MQNVYNNKNPLFFLFTSVKDGRVFINKLFDSLLKQSKVNFVHYIYEDGSNDPIEDLVDIYKEKNSKLSNPIQIIYEKNPKNIGLNMATKHCIDMCNLPYFLWINCDDWVDDNFFEELEKAVRKHDDGCVFQFKTRFYNGNKVGVRPCNNYDKYLLHFKNKNLELLANKIQYNHFCVNHKKYLEVNKNNYFIDKRSFYNDQQVLIPLAYSNAKFYYCNKVVSNYLIRGNSESFLLEETVLFDELFDALGIKDYEHFLELKEQISNSIIGLAFFYRNRNYRVFRKRLIEYKKMLKENGLPLKLFCYGEKPFIHWIIITHLRTCFKI